MINLSAPVSQYRAMRIREVEGKYMFVSPRQLKDIEEDVKEYAIARQGWKERRAANFNPFTDDPNCKSCKKKKG